MQMKKNICSCDFLYLFPILWSTQSLLGVYHSLVWLISFICIQSQQQILSPNSQHGWCRTYSTIYVKPPQWLRPTGCIVTSGSFFCWGVLFFHSKMDGRLSHFGFHQKSQDIRTWFKGRCLRNTLFPFSRRIEYAWQCCHDIGISNFSTIPWKILMFNTIFSTNGKHCHNIKRIQIIKKCYQKINMTNPV